MDTLPPILFAHIWNDDDDIWEALKNGEGGGVFQTPILFAYIANDDDDISS